MCELSTASLLAICLAGLRVTGPFWTDYMERICNCRDDIAWVSHERCQLVRCRDVCTHCVALLISLVLMALIQEAGNHAVVTLACWQMCRFADVFPVHLFRQPQHITSMVGVYCRWSCGLLPQPDGTQWLAASILAWLA